MKALLTILAALTLAACQPTQPAFETSDTPVQRLSQKNYNDAMYVLNQHAYKCETVTDMFVVKKRPSPQVLIYCDNYRRMYLSLEGGTIIKPL